MTVVAAAAYGLTSRGHLLLRYGWKEPERWRRFVAFAETSPAAGRIPSVLELAGLRLFIDREYARAEKLFAREVESMATPRPVLIPRAGHGEERPQVLARALYCQAATLHRMKEPKRATAVVERFTREVAGHLDILYLPEVLSASFSDRPEYRSSWPMSTALESLEVARRAGGRRP